MWRRSSRTAEVKLAPDLVGRRIRDGKFAGFASEDRRCPSPPASDAPYGSPSRRSRRRCRARPGPPPRPDARRCRRDARRARAARTALPRLPRPVRPQRWWSPHHRRSQCPSIVPSPACAACRSRPHRPRSLARIRKNAVSRRAARSRPIRRVIRGHASRWRSPSCPTSGLRDRPSTCAMRASCSETPRTSGLPALAGRSRSRSWPDLSRCVPRGPGSFVPRRRG